LDNDESGCLSLAELTDALTDAVNQAHVDDALDLVMAGKVTWNPSLAVGGDFEHVLLGIFQVIDSDRDMCLCKKELRKVGGKRQRAIHYLFMNELPPSCKSWEDKCLHQVRLMLSKTLIIGLDTDNSGCICGVELTAALTDDDHRALMWGALGLTGKVKWEHLQSARKEAGDYFVVKGIIDKVDTTGDKCLSADEVAVVDSEAVVGLFSGRA